MSNFISAVRASSVEIEFISWLSQVRAYQFILIFVHPTHHKYEQVAVQALSDPPFLCSRMGWGHSSTPGQEGRDRRPDQTPFSKISLVKKGFIQRHKRFNKKRKALFENFFILFFIGSMWSSLCGYSQQAFYNSEAATLLCNHAGLWWRWLFFAAVLCSSGIKTIKVPNWTGMRCTMVLGCICCCQLKQNRFFFFLLYWVLAPHFLLIFFLASFSPV